MHANLKLAEVLLIVFFFNKIFNYGIMSEK